MIFFAWLVPTCEIQKFGAIKPYAITTPSHALFNFFRKLNVSSNLYSHTIDRLCRQISQLSKGRSNRFSNLCFKPVSGYGFFIGLKNDYTLIAIKNNWLTTRNICQERANSNNGRYLKPFCNDRRMAPWSTKLCCKTFYKTSIQICCFTWRQIMS